MKFVYFTDIHLCEGRDSEPGFKTCIESMLAHEPEVLVNGGDLGITPAATALYAELTRDIPVPIVLSNGNHEMCSGYLPRERAGTLHSSVDIGGVHFVALDVVRYFEPTEEHRWNWHVLADEYLLEWLSEDLAGIDRHTPLVVATHVPLSTTFPGMDFPTNEIACGERILEYLKPFVHVITLHGHDHENCRHFVDHIEIMTTAAVAGNWWKNGLDSRCAHGREPQAYAVAIAAAIAYRDPDDPGAEHVETIQEHGGIDAVLHEVCGLPNDAALAPLVKRAWNAKAYRIFGVD